MEIRNHRPTFSIGNDYTFILRGVDLPTHAQVNSGRFRIRFEHSSMSVQYQWGMPRARPNPPSTPAGTVLRLVMRLQSSRDLPVDKQLPFPRGIRGVGELTIVIENEQGVEVARKEENNPPTDIE